MNSWIALVVNVLAVFYVVWMITSPDSPLSGLRERTAGRRPNSFLAKWSSCPWCVGLWVGVGVSVLSALVPQLWFYVATVLALAAGAALLISWEGRA